MKTNTLSAVIAILILCGLSFISIAEASGSVEFSRQIENILPGQMEQYNVPGISIALIEGGDIVYKKKLRLR